MKDLTQSLEEIKKSDLPLAQKKEMCIKLGLRPRDVEYLEFSGFFNDDCLTFGVEIECNVYRNRLMEIARQTGLVYQYEGYNHRDNDHYYKFTTDASVDGFSPAECVSPILKDNTDGFESLKTCLDTLNRAGAAVNRSCGLHVHVGLKGFEEDKLKNIYINYQRMEVLIDSFMAPSRRGNENTYGKSLLGKDFSHCGCARSLANLIGTRYVKVNPQAFFDHKTVEFRQHQGSVDYEKISMWARFCCKLVAWSKKNVLDRDIISVEDIPFLNAEEKVFFTRRIEYFANRGR